MTRTVTFFSSVTLDDPPDAAPKAPKPAYSLSSPKEFSSYCCQSLLQGASQQWQAAAPIKEAVSTSPCCDRLKYSGTEYRLPGFGAALSRWRRGCVASCDPPRPASGSECTVRYAVLRLGFRSSTTRVAALLEKLGPSASLYLLP